MVVHVPFFKIDLPEPRIAFLVLDAVHYLIKFASRLLDVGTVALDLPLTPAQQRSPRLRGFPREYDRVLKRWAEGKINEEQISSEANDASFDYYRRAMRTAIIGETDEDMLDLAERKLGLDDTPASVLVQDAFESEEGDELLRSTPAEALGLHDPESASQLYSSLQAQLDEEAALAMRRAERAEASRTMAAECVSHRRRARTAATNVSSGLVLGLFIAKATAVVARKLLPKKKVLTKKEARRAAAAEELARAQAAAAAAAAVGLQTGRSGSMGGQQQQAGQGAAGSSTSQQQQGQQQGAQQPAAPVKRTRPVTRRR